MSGVECMCGVLYIFLSSFQCALYEFSTENDFVGVEAIDSLWFIDIMRALILHVLHYIVYLTIYFQLMTVATDTATAAAAAAETIQHAVPV